MTLDGLLVEFVANVTPHNGKDTLQIVLAPPGNMKTWLSISKIAREIKNGTATKKDISRYESTINDCTMQTCMYPKGFYLLGMICGVESVVSNYKFLLSKNQNVDINFFPSMANEYLKHYHPELFKN